MSIRSLQENNFMDAVLSATRAIEITPIKPKNEIQSFDQVVQAETKTNELKPDLESKVKSEKKTDTHEQDISQEAASHAKETQSNQKQDEQQVAKNQSSSSIEIKNENIEKNEAETEVDAQIVAENAVCDILPVYVAAPQEEEEIQIQDGGDTKVVLESKAAQFKKSASSDETPLPDLSGKTIDSTQAQIIKSHDRQVAPEMTLEGENEFQAKSQLLPELLHQEGELIPEKNQNHLDREINQLPSRSNLTTTTSFANPVVSSDLPKVAASVNREFKASAVTAIDSSHSAAPRANTVKAAETLRRAFPQDRPTTLMERAIQKQVNDALQTNLIERKKEAHIQLKPDEWGKISIKLDVKKSDINLNFLAEHVSVREVLDRNMPQLKQNLENMGLQLGQVHVGLMKEESHSQEAFQNQNTWQGSEVENEENKTTQSIRLDPSRLVDHLV